MDICGDNRFEIIARAKEHLLNTTNIHTSKDEMKVLDDFLFRCWQMGWLDRYDRKTKPTISKMEQVETMSCQECKHWNVYKGCRERVCKYEPKDEPQTETEIAKAIVHKMIDDAVLAEDAYPDLRQKMHDAVDEYEPQTDCAWK